MKRYTPEDKALASQQNCESIPEVNCFQKSFQRSCHVQLDVDILHIIGYCI